VSETVESSSSVTVAVVNVTSVTVAVHIGFGHDPGGADGVSDVTVNRAWPFRGVANGPLVPVTVVLKLCPGATLPAGLVQVTLAVPGADTVIVKVVPPRPATLPLHDTCVPMSLQVGSPTKCPACANAAPPKVVSSASAATVATTRRRTERFMSVYYLPPDAMVLTGRAAVTGQLGEPVVAVEGEMAVRDHAGQGVAWLPPLRTRTTVSAACSNRVILSPSLAGVKVLGESSYSVRFSVRLLLLL
jgi:hypothetical protein